MKNHSFIYKICLFSLILAAFVIPPLFVSKETAGEPFTVWKLSLNQLTFCFSAILIYTASKYKLLKKENEEVSEETKPARNFFYSYFFPSSYALCLMLTIALVLQIISLRLLNNAGQIPFIMPEGFGDWACCIINFICASVWEEIIFRYYLTESLYDFFPSLKDKTALKIITEFIVLLLFAFGHRYSGYLAVINAGLSHIILRLCFLRTNKNIYCTIIIHFIFNMISMLIV